jgi:hypothetical protein
MIPHLGFGFLPCADPDSHAPSFGIGDIFSPFCTDDPKLGLWVLLHLAWLILIPTHFHLGLVISTSPHFTLMIPHSPPPKNVEQDIYEYVDHKKNYKYLC